MTDKKGSDTSIGRDGEGAEIPDAEESVRPFPPGSEERLHPVIKVDGGTVDEIASRDIEEEQPGSFVVAFLIGAMIAGVGVCYVVPYSDYWTSLSSGAALWVCISCFAGGLASGFCLRRDLRSHGWRLLWLAAVSPALPIWVFTIILLFIGAQFDAASFRFVFFACAVSLAGAVAGYHADFWKRIIGSSPFRYVAGFLTALVLGTLTTLFLLWFTFGLTEDVFMEGWPYDIVAAVAAFILGSLALFLGGYVSGVLLTSILPRLPQKYLLLAAASPAIPVLLFWFPVFSEGQSPGSFFGSYPAMLPVCAASLAVPILGAVAGHRHTMRKRRAMRPQEAFQTSQPATTDARPNE